MSEDPSLAQGGQKVLIYEPYQIANMQRLLGEYYFRIGQLDKS